jgi:hypothetical protein
VRGVRIPDPLPAVRSTLPTTPSSNQQLFAFICAGTVTIAASIDESDCSWSIFGDDPPLESASEPSLNAGRMKYKLFGWSGQGFVYSVGVQSSPSFGRREFVWIPKNSTIFTVVSNPTGPGQIFRPQATRSPPSRARGVRILASAR